ncbi:MAG: DNA-methyltransferase [Pyrinomonadaceae bacterium]
MAHEITANRIIHGDCLDVMRTMPADSVDLVLTSPPYENARTYGIGFKLSGQEWVSWSVRRWLECERLCIGMVAWVVAGKTKDFRWSATPSLLEADLHRLGVNLRDPRVFHRVGIPGSGGPDDWRHDHERIIVSTRPGKLPWSDNTANGSVCVYKPGGAMSYRHADGVRRNAKTGSRLNRRREAGETDVQSRRKSDGERKLDGLYVEPKIANAGNVIKCLVGGGLMGSDLAHNNEAPFPESLVEPFIECFCPPGGTVLDPFCGSGTTLAIAERLGRRWIGIDCREEMAALSQRRIEEALAIKAEEAARKFGDA